MPTPTSAPETILDEQEVTETINKALTTEGYKMPDVWEKMNENQQAFAMAYFHTANKQFALKYAYPDYKHKPGNMISAACYRLMNSDKVIECLAELNKQASKEIQVPVLMNKLYSIAQEPLTSKRVKVADQIKAVELLLKTLQALPADNTVQINLQMNIPILNEKNPKELELEASIIEAELLEQDDEEEHQD